MPVTTSESFENPETAEVSITANVTAGELKFDAVLNPNVEFPGKPERATVWESDRRNLPQTVEPGVAYRNIGIRLRIASRFADIDRIVAEALSDRRANSESAAPDSSAVTQKDKAKNNGLQATTARTKKSKR